jgi:hypothetical protein
MIYFLNNSMFGSRYNSKHILVSMIYFDSDMSKSTNTVVYFDWKMSHTIYVTRIILRPLSIIQSLYYAPAGRYINSSSDSADRGRSIIRVT